MIEDPLFKRTNVRFILQIHHQFFDILLERSESEIISYSLSCSFTEPFGKFLIIGKLRHRLCICFKVPVGALDTGLPVYAYIVNSGTRDRKCNCRVSEEHAFCQSKTEGLILRYRREAEYITA